MNTPDYVAAVLANAEAGGIHNAELAALRRRLRQLADPQAGLLPGEVLQPVADLPRLDELPVPPTDRARDVLDRLVVIKLNGGLGTSMGLPGPKSLLEVKPGMSFLDVLATQVLVLRERYRARLPLVLMNSAATRGRLAGGAGAATAAFEYLACRWISCRAASPKSAPITGCRRAGRPAGS